MWKQRVITAIVLLAVLLGTLLASSPWPLVSLCVLLAASALWEWLRLTWPKQGTPFPILLAALAAAGLLLLAYQWLSATPANWSTSLRQTINQWLMPLVAAIWVIVSSAMVYQGQSQVREGDSGSASCRERVCQYV